MIGIYKITNKINGKVYVGQSVNIQMRWYSHKAEFIHQKYDTKLYRAMQKYGFENFQLDILEECQQEELDQKEAYWIQYYDSYNTGYNETLGGQGFGYYVYDTNKIRSLWDEGLSVGDIVNLLHCNKTTVYTRLKDYENYSKEESRQRGRNVKYHPERLPESRNKYFQN